MTYPVHGLPSQTFAPLLADPQIAYIHAHNSARGCFSARIERN